MPSFTRTIPLAFVAAVLLLTGCESMKDLGQEMGLNEGETANVDVPFPQLGEQPVRVVVTASTQDASKQAIRLLRINEYAQAAATLEAAVAADPTDHRSFFALGIAREMQGNNGSARDAYVKAISLDSEQREYTQALNRVKMKLGED